MGNWFSNTSGQPGAGNETSRPASKRQRQGGQEGVSGTGQQAPARTPVSDFPPEILAELQMESDGSVCH